MRKLLVALGLMTAVLLGASGSTSAGGWVVISLDATPIFRAGEPTEIGFTMLRHGVTLESEQPDARRADRVHRSRRPSHDGRRRTVGRRRPPRRHRDPARGRHLHVAVRRCRSCRSTRVSSTCRPDPAPSAAAAVDSPIWPIVQWSTAVLAIGMALLAGAELVRSRRRPVAA